MSIDDAAEKRAHAIDVVARESLTIDYVWLTRQKLGVATQQAITARARDIRDRSDAVKSVGAALDYLRGEQ